MANWWENIQSSAADVFGNIGKNALRNVVTSNPLTGPAAVGLDNLLASGQALTGQPVREGSLAEGLARMAGTNNVADKAYLKQQDDLQRLGGAESLRSLIGGEIAGQQAGMPQGVTFEDFLSTLLGGGGGPDLSGYDTMLSDVAARESALGSRRAEQQAYLEGIIGASRQRRTALQDSVAGRVQGQLDADATRRLAEQNALREQDAERLAVTNQAREALGVSSVPADLTSAEAQSAIGANIGAGTTAERDARMRESIQNQQYARQLASLDPMQLQYSTALSNNYEDRLAALASERAQIQGQRAQAAASGGGGPSISDYAQAYGLYGEIYGAPEKPGILGIADQFSPYTPKASQISNAWAQFLGSSGIGNAIKAGQKLDNTSIMNAIVGEYPDVFLGDAAATAQLQMLVDDLVG